MTNRDRSRSAQPTDGSRPPRHTARLATLVFVRHRDDVLLLRHPHTHPRFAGLWNGIGGHVEPAEDIRAAAIRELREEAGIRASAPALRAVIHEESRSGQATVVFAFSAVARDRRFTAAEGHEMAWHPLELIAEIPLVDDLASLLPRLLAAKDPLFVTASRMSPGRASRSIAVPGAPAGGPHV